MAGISLKPKEPRNIQYLEFNNRGERTVESIDIGSDPEIFALFRLDTEDPLDVQPDFILEELVLNCIGKNGNVLDNCLLSFMMGSTANLNNTDSQLEAEINNTLSFVKTAEQFFNATKYNLTAQKYIAFGAWNSPSNSNSTLKEINCLATIIIPQNVSVSRVI